MPFWQTNNNNVGNHLRTKSIFHISWPALQRGKAMRDVVGLVGAGEELGGKKSPMTLKCSTNYSKQKYPLFCLMI